MIRFTLLLWRARRIQAQSIAQVAIIICGAFLYVLVLSDRTAVELLVYPKWSRSLSSAESIPSLDIPQEEITAFRLSNIFGHISSNGTLVNAEPILFDVAYSHSRYANYNKDSNQIVVKDHYGRHRFSILEYGYPRIKDDRVLLLGAHGDSVSEWNEKEGLVWQREHGAVISAVALEANHTLLGLLDGRTVFINADGSLNYEYRHHQNPLVVGVALSPDRSLSAVAAGVNPTTLVVLEHGVGPPQEIARATLPATLFELQPLYILANQKSILFERGETLYQFDILTSTLRSVKKQVTLVHISRSLCCTLLITDATVLMPNSGVMLQFIHNDWGEVFEIAMPYSAQVQPYFGSFSQDASGILMGYNDTLYYVEASWQ